MKSILACLIRRVNILFGIQILSDKQRKQDSQLQLALEKIDNLERQLAKSDALIISIQKKLDTSELNVSRIQHRADSSELRLNNVEPRTDQSELRLMNLEPRVDALEIGRAQWSDALERLNKDLSLKIHYQYQSLQQRLDQQQFDAAITSKSALNLENSTNE